MANIARKSDGRRIFTDKFKHEHIRRIARGEVTVTELSRKLGIARSLLHRWKRQDPQGAAMESMARRRPTRASELGAARYIHELQLLVGKQTVELELLRGELDALRKKRGSK